MKKKHFSCFVTSLHGNVCADGGCDYVRKLLSSMFDLITNKWTTILDTKEGRSCCAACVTGDYDDGMACLLLLRHLIQKHRNGHQYQTGQLNEVNVLSCLLGRIFLFWGTAMVF